VLRVQKKMWLRGSRSWHAGRSRGGTSSGGATWGKQGRASVGSGSGGADAGATCGAVKGGAEAAGALDMADTSGGGASGREAEEEEGR
jgi:hypothetical protein